METATHRAAHAPEQVEACLETLCLRGCRSVLRDIERLERGEVFAEVESLDAADRRLLLAEMRSIMAVYEGECRLPCPEEPTAAVGTALLSP